MTQPSSHHAVQTDENPYRYTAELAGEIELRWQAWWEAGEIYRQPNPGEPGFSNAAPKRFLLDMFPYPSGAGLHVGHPEGFTATDIYGRFERMNGANVLHAMGWDAFGLPAEQYAIKTGVHPAETTRTAIDNFRRQLKRFGFEYDWSREFGTIDPGYYKWTQWIFLKLYTSWFDPDAGSADDDNHTPGRARPITELVEEFEQGARPVRFNPHAVEIDETRKAADHTPWHALDDVTRRDIIDSYRLAFLGEQTVNWCPKLGTALANEEVIDGKSERGGFPVFRKPLRQWLLRITAYADRLLADLHIPAENGGLDWPASTRTQQTEWIGRSDGAEVDFPVQGMDAAPLRIYTTRPDTIFGATFMVVAPEHPLVEAVLATPPAACDADAVRTYAAEARNRTDVERQEAKEKTGVRLGVDVTNPATGKAVPVFVADYVLMGYGTGAIMAVPAQDQRDWDFAKTHELPIVRTVQPTEGFEGEAFTGDGPAINSANSEISLDGLGVKEAKSKIINWLEAKGLGTRKTNYRLRDWLFSRQRYWGEPFPIVFDNNGRHHAIADGALPLELPPLADYQPVESEDPAPLLAKATTWLHTTAADAQVLPTPGCEPLAPDAPVTREANTMPGWAGSCWYYLRYCDPHNDERFVGREAERGWMLGPREGVNPGEAMKFGTFEPHLHKLGGVDLYIGGAEHATLHLLYARFWHKVLFDLGEVSTPEPFHKLFHQGLITSFAYQRPDKSLVPVDAVEDLGKDEVPQYIEIATGVEVKQITAKMSKSLHNVVNPDDVIELFGADTFRLYEMYMGPLEASKPWNTRDTVGLFRFLQRAWRLCIDEQTGALRLAESHDEEIEKKLHRTIAKVTTDIPALSFNTAIASLIEFVNAAMGEDPTLTEDQIDRFARTLAPLAPHIAEELWHRLGRHDESAERGGSIAWAAWPGFDESKLVDDTIEIPVQIMGKLRSKVFLPPDASPADMEAAALADPRVMELIEGKTVRKVVTVPGRLVNIVAN